MQARTHQKGMLTGCFCLQEPLAVNPRRNTRRGKTPSSTASDEDVMGEMKQDSKGAGVAATDATDQPSKTIPLPAAKKKRGRSPNPPPNLRTKQPKEKKAKFDWASGVLASQRCKGQKQFLVQWAPTPCRVRHIPLHIELGYKGGACYEEERELWQRVKAAEQTASEALAELHTHKDAAAHATFELKEVKKASAARHAEAAAVRSALREVQSNSPSSQPLSHMQADMAQLRSAARHYDMSSFEDISFSLVLKAPSCLLFLISSLTLAAFQRLLVKCVTRDLFRGQSLPVLACPIHLGN
ncbi:TPA: hypothetical protein ACH3X1_009225 [Trebouxia sp. C0004]